MKISSLTSALRRLQEVVVRFPVSLLLLIGFAVLSWLEINAGYYIPSQQFYFFPTGTIVGITAMLGVENLRFQQWKKHGLTLVCVLLWSVYCAYLPDKNMMYFDSGLQFFILGAVFVVAAFFISFPKKNQDAAFWGFSRNAVVRLCESVIFGVVIFAGLSVALLSVDSLFDIAVSDKYYLNLAVCCFILFTPIYFLTTVPDKTKKYQADLSFNQALRILGVYIALPILGLYIAILYTYLIKIVAVWELPNGWVSTLVSILAVGGLLVMLILYPVWLKKEDKVVNFFTRYFGLLILPLLVLMSVGIFRRIADYGITINRCYILVLNLWFYGIFIYLFLTKNRHIRWIVISPTIIFLLASIGPWRISNIVKQSIYNRLETTLSQLDFLDGGKISMTDSKIYFAQMDSTAKASVREPLDYLADTYGMASIQPFFTDDVTAKTRYNLIRDLYLNLTGSVSNSIYFLITVDNIALPNINDYHSFVYFNTANGDTLSIPIHNGIHKLVKAGAKDGDYVENIPFSTTNENLVIKESKYSLYIKEVNGHYYRQNDSITISSFDGFLFYK
ncbi:hypothetical protein AGMMS49965_17400 [Bacteroidia bacterium]|nr:hypothetical protein AGMMS49965_17400 [Bacteroidia bacterium]